MYFPSEFNKGKSKEYNTELIKLIRLELDEIIEGEPKEGKQGHEKRMLELEKPNVWNINSTENMEVEMETEFEKFMLAVSEHTNESLDNISAFRFYALIGYIKEKNPKKN